MFRKFLLILLPSLIMLAAKGQMPENGAAMCSKRKMSVAHLEERTLRSALSTRHAFDVLSYTLDINLENNFTSPYQKNFQANVIVKFRVDSTLNKIVLNAVNSSLTIDSITMNAASYTHSGNLLTITLDKEYTSGQEASVRIWYRHNNVTDGAFYASGGFVFTDCEPEGARYWIPCYDKPSDKALTDFTAKVPATVKLGSNGRLQDSINDGTFIKYHWVSRDPVSTYLMVLTARTNYNLDIVKWTNPRTSEVVPIRFYYNPGENPSNIKSIIGDVTTFFSDKFGDHPFEKNGFAALNSQFAWGGMENQTLTSICPGCWSEMLIVHEFAHQWFGDMITCNTWADIFLNEGFATYLESLWIENRYGAASYKNDVLSNANSYLSGNPGWAISNPAWAVTTPGVNTLFNYSITYAKGACVLYMLRYVMGDAPFFAGMNAYANNPHLKYGTANISEFKNEMEAASGQDLDWFFDQWIYKPNHPQYTNTYSFAKNGSKWNVYFEAAQYVPVAGTYWQMPIELKIRFTTGNDTVIKVFNSFNHQPYSWEFDREPFSVAFDPYTQIVLKNAATVVSAGPTVPVGNTFALKASPVPFRNGTQIFFTLSKSCPVKLDLYDNTGTLVKQLKDEFLPAGEHSLRLSGSGLGAGSYFVVLHAAGQVQSLKLLHSGN